MKTLFSLCLVGLIVAPLLPLASAHGVCTGIPPRFGRLDDVHFSSQSIQTGDTIIITGNITMMVQQDLQGYLSIHSSPSPHARWIVVSTEPSEKMIDVTQFSRVPFSITIKALQPGTYKLSPILNLPEMGPAFSMLNGCNTEPVITVTGESVCNTGFVSVLKSEDGSSFCVKPDTAQKLIERGWTQSVIKNISQINSGENQTMPSSYNCLGKEISKNQNGSMVVLLMNPNSTATVCTTYQFDYNWDSYPNKNIYERGIVHFGLNLGPKFNVTTTPSSLNITNALEGATFSVLYKISSTPDSKGIYDSIPWGSCEQYPLAVGYTASELKKSDFPLEMLLDRPCYNVIFHAASNKIISGMDYAEVIVNGQ